MSIALRVCVIILVLITSVVLFEPPPPEPSKKKKRIPSMSPTVETAVSATKQSKDTHKYSKDSSSCLLQEPTRTHEHSTPPSQRAATATTAPLLDCEHAVDPQALQKPSNSPSSSPRQANGDYSPTLVGAPNGFELFGPSHHKKHSALGSSTAPEPFDYSIWNGQPEVDNNSRPAEAPRFPDVEALQTSNIPSSPSSPSSDSSYKTALESPRSDDSFHSARSSLLMSPTFRHASISLDEAVSRFAADRLDIELWAARVQSDEAS